MSFIPKGIIPALITPLTNDEKLNEKALRKLLNFTIDGGVHGVFVIGTTGEFYGLTPQEKKEIMQITMDEVNGRVPVYAGTGAITTKESVQLSQIAQECGVDAVSVLTPLFISINQKELYDHFRVIAENTDLPVILYNNLPKTGITITAATVAKLAQIKNIVGVKDSTGDMTLTGEYIRLTKEQDFSVLMGRDTMIHAALCYGATGSIAAGANVAPRLCADIYDLYMSGDIQGSLEAQYKLAPLRIAFTLGSFPTVIKESLELLGIEAGPCMAPVGPMTVDEKEQLKKVLIQMELLK